MKIAKKSIVIVMSTFLLLSGCSNNKNESNVTNKEQVVTKVQNISAKAVKDKIDNGEKLIILDVREVSEYDEGHIKDSILLSVGAIESNIEK